MTDIPLYAFFRNSSNLNGEIGLSPTIDIYRTTRSDLTSSKVVNNQAMTEIGGGVYAYQVVDGDIKLYDYIGVAKTVSAAVEAKHVMAERYDSGVIGEVKEDVWDDLLTGSNHNLPTSAGRRLREITANIITTGTTVASTVNTITLNGDASSVDGAYDPALISIVENTGMGQSRLILEYKGDTKIAVVDRNWKTLPDDTSIYSITGHPGREHTNEGLARGGTINTITLNALASDTDNVYRELIIYLRSGTGEDQVGIVSSYVGSTKVATLRSNWAITPDDTTGYIIIPTPIPAAISLGVGSISNTVTVEDEATNPLDGVDVWVTTDEAGTNVIARDSTDDLGQVTFLLDAGTYYVWKQHASYTFINPETLEVVA